MERLNLAVSSPYITGSYIMKAFLEKNPGLARELASSVIADRKTEGT